MLACLYDDIWELIKYNSPSLSIAYASAIFTLPFLTDLISEPLRINPASYKSSKK